MVKKLKEIIDFLENHKDYNKNLQTQFALNTISFKANNFEKLVALLYDTINTQSQPNIDNVSQFIRHIYSKKDKLNSFSGFFEFITSHSIEEYEKKDIYNQLFKSMTSTKANGWGPKTSALLIKNIYNVHHVFNLSELKIWDDDVPALTDDDKLYLPVDAVILAIFNKLYPNTKSKWSFNTINKILHENFSNKDMILFDDLWFWGFITQNGIGENRKFEWNEGKYWIIKESNKDETVRKEIEDKAKDFLKLIGV